MSLRRSTPLTHSNIPEKSSTASNTPLTASYVGVRLQTMLLTEPPSEKESTVAIGRSVYKPVHDTPELSDAEPDDTSREQ